MQLFAITLLALAANDQADRAATTAAPSPAQKKIEWALDAIEREPGQARHYNQLALALTRRARETANPDDYVDAQEALAQSLELAPGNYEARKLQIWAKLGLHEFAIARVLAEELNRQVPDDVIVYGFVADACVELGDYEAAEEAVRWMLKLRPGNVPGVTRAAYLRELFGDIEGAAQLMLQAYHAMDPTETEDRAWALTHVAHLERSRGRVEPARAYATQALATFPDYHYALFELAAVETAAGDHAAAAALLRTRAEGAPHPENFAHLAGALEKAGQVDEADELYAEFEEAALAESGNDDNANGDLIAYFIDRGRASEALDLARIEVAAKRNVRSLSDYAWALQANGNFREAARQMDAALEVGIQDAEMLYRAGTIAIGADDLEAAQSYLERSLRLNPHSPVAPQARERLAHLDSLTTD